MIKLDKKVEYALIVLKHLLEHGEDTRITTRQLCEKYDVPFDVIGRVMQVMVQRNWLKSIRGAHGGYLLQADLKTLSLYDLMAAILGPVDIVNCMNNRFSSCDREANCTIFLPLKVLNQKVLEFYNRIMIYDLLTWSEDDAQKIDTVDSTSLLTWSNLK